MSQRCRDVQLALVDAGEGRAGRHYQKGGRAERHGDHDAEHGFGQSSAKRAPHDGVGANQVDEDDTRHDGWQGEGRLHDHADDRRDPAGRPREEVGEWDAEDRHERERDRRGTERHPQSGKETRRAKAPLRGGRQTHDEGREGHAEVEGNDGRQDHQGRHAASAHRRPSGCDRGERSHHFTVDGARTTFIGRRESTPFASKILRPAPLSKKDKNERAAASWGAARNTATV